MKEMGNLNHRVNIIFVEQYKPLYVNITSPSPWLPFGIKELCCNSIRTLPTACNWRSVIVS